MPKGQEEKAFVSLKETNAFLMWKKERICEYLNKN